METSKQHKITIVGCGPGAPEYLTMAARHAIDRAAVLAGSSHLLDLYAEKYQEKIVFSNMDAFLTTLERQWGNGNITVLVSGDPGLCSLSTQIIGKFGYAACEVIPGISSVQTAFSRLGMEWQDVLIISAHKEIPDLTAKDLAGYGKIAVLAGHRRSQQWITELMETLTPPRSLIVCENLTMPTEYIRRVSGSEFQRLNLSTRTIVLIIKEKVS